VDYHQDLTDDGVTEVEFIRAVSSVRKKCRFYPKVADFINAVQEDRKKAKMPSANFLQIEDTTSFHDQTPEERALTKKKLKAIASMLAGKLSMDEALEIAGETIKSFGRTQIGSGLVTKKIKTMEDVNHMGNAMANIDGHYPVGMTGCYVVGINGGCGMDCPVYLKGECEEPQEFEGHFETKEEEARHFELYS